MAQERREHFRRKQQQLYDWIRGCRRRWQLRLRGQRRVQPGGYFRGSHTNGQQLRARFLA